MVDFDESIQLINKAESLEEMASNYLLSQISFAKLKYELDMHIIANMDQIQARRKNIGYEMATLELINITKDEGIKKLYREYLEEEAKIKGWEKLIKAKETYISLNQSVMRLKLGL